MSPRVEPVLLQQKRAGQSELGSPEKGPWELDVGSVKRDVEERHPESD